MSWSWSDGPGLEPAAASAATCASGAAAAAARAEAGVADGAKKALVSCQESPVPEHLKLWAGALQVGRAAVALPHRAPRPRQRGGGLPGRGTGSSQAEPSEPASGFSSVLDFLQTQAEGQ